MSRKTVASLVLVAIFISTASFAEMIEKKDRFTGATTFSTRYDPQGEGIPQVLFIIVLASKESKFIFSTIIITRYADSWKYSDCHNTYFLADDEPVELPKSTVERSVKDQHTIEDIKIKQVSLEQLQHLARARKVEYKICADEYQMTPTEQQDLREAISFIQKAQQ